MRRLSKNKYRKRCRRNVTHFLLSDHRDLIGYHQDDMLDEVELESKEDFLKRACNDSEYIWLWRRLYKATLAANLPAENNTVDYFVRSHWN